MSRRFAAGFLVGNTLRGGRSAGLPPRTGAASGHPSLTKSRAANEPGAEGPNVPGRTLAVHRVVRLADPWQRPVIDANEVSPRGSPASRRWLMAPAAWTRRRGHPLDDVGKEIAAALCILAGALT